MKPGMRFRGWYQRKFGWVPKPVRQIIISVIGGTMLLLGLFMVIPFVPGPGFLLIPIGLAILALEFAWATRWLLKIRRAAANMQERMQSEHAPFHVRCMAWCQRCGLAAWQRCRAVFKRPKSASRMNGP